MTKKPVQPQEVELPEHLPMRLHKGKGRGGGQPTKLTLALIEKLTTILSTGATIDSAVRYVGINRQNFTNWVAKGREDTLSGKRTVHAKFFGSLESAIASADIREHALVAKAARVDWKAAAWHIMARSKLRSQFGGFDAVQKLFRAAKAMGVPLEERSRWAGIAEKLRILPDEVVDEMMTEEGITPQLDTGPIPSPSVVRSPGEALAALGDDGPVDAEVVVEELGRS
jgi:hypothetical protein